MPFKAALFVVLNRTYDTIGDLRLGLRVVTNRFVLFIFNQHCSLHMARIRFIFINIRLLRRISPKRNFSFSVKVHHTYFDSDFVYERFSGYAVNYSNRFEVFISSTHVEDLFINSNIVFKNIKVVEKRLYRYLKMIYSVFEIKNLLFFCFINLMKQNYLGLTNSPS